MTVETNEIFQFITDNGFKQKGYRVRGGYLTIDYSGPYNIRSACRMYHYKRLMIEFDFEWLTIYNGFKKIYRCFLSEKPGWGNQDHIKYLDIPEPVIYFIKNKDFEGQKSIYKREKSERYIPKKIRKLIFELFGHKCNLCGASDHLEIDHIFPFSKGGSSKKHNLQLLCKPCNRKKFNKLPL